MTTQSQHDRKALAIAAISLREKRFSPSELAALLEVASEAGIEASAVLAETDLDLDAITNPSR